MNYLSPLYVTNGTNTLTLNSAAPSITSNTSFAIGSNGGTQLTFNSAGTTITSTAELLLPASTTSIASLNIPSTGVAPTSPAYGDIWVTNTGPYIKIAANNVIPTFRDEKSCERMFWLKKIVIHTFGIGICGGGQF